MNTSLTPQQTFEKTIEDRLRKDMGELIPDEVLKEIVEKAMNKFFFEGEKTDSRYGTRIDPPWIVNVVKPLVEQQAREEVSKWCKENSEEIQKILEEVVGNNMGDLIRNGFNSITESIFNNFRYNLENALINR